MSDASKSEPLLTDKLLLLKLLKIIITLQTHENKMQNMLEFE